MKKKPDRLTGRGGAGRGQGRKKKAVGEKFATASISLPPAALEALDALREPGESRGGMLVRVLELPVS